MAASGATGLDGATAVVTRPEEVADAILFFAGPRSDFVTGQVLSVSGGLTVAG